jgi:hypothetical protein
LERDSGEEVGTYQIRIGTLDGGSNYSIAFSGALFTISRPDPVEIKQVQDSPSADPVPLFRRNGEGGGTEFKAQINTQPDVVYILMAADSMDGPFTEVSRVTGDGNGMELNMDCGTVKHRVFKLIVE